MDDGIIVGIPYTPKLEPMLKNYLLVSIRNLKRHFTYSFVNIFGLTVGLACTLVIGLWVHQEYSYDKHFDEADKIYRIGVGFFGIHDLSVGPDILKEKLATYTDVEAASSLSAIGKTTFIVNQKEVPVGPGYRADESFFDIFSYSFISGNASSAMSKPHSIVLTEEAAKQLFGTTDVLNQTIEIQNEEHQYTVAGVVSIEGNSHLPAKFWITREDKPVNPSWTSASGYQYVRMKGTDHQERLTEILEEQMKEVHPLIAAGDSYETFINSGNYTFYPMPITDIHMKSNLKFEPSPTGNELTVKLFAGIALLILTLASINFINISTARATTRAKEVGIRKSLGTNRPELILQFVLESVIVCLISVTLAIGIGEFFLNSFEKLTGLELLPSLFGSYAQVVIIYLASIVLGIIAGAYPSIYITRFRPVRVLKGQLDINEKGNFRNGLVLFQFAISISLLIVSIFIFHQLRFIETRDKGFDTDNTLVIEYLGRIGEDGKYLRDELAKKSYVELVSTNRRVPAGSNISVTEVTTEDEREFWLQVFIGDANYIDCMGYRLMEGRNFSSEIATDTSAIILNESAVLALGLEDPVGTRLSDGKFKVIGVVSDFNYESMKKKIEPAMLMYSDYSDELITVKYSSQYTEDLVSEVNRIWDSFGVDDKANYYFLDENFARLVEKEKVLSKAVLVFTVLAMFISCLGLYGLSIFTAERRTKEIGIRRVLGASISSITKLLSQNFARPIIIAFVIATPVAFLITKNWLNNYEYRIDIAWWPFITGGVIALSLGLITISWQSIRAALKNPVESLRTE